MEISPPNIKVQRAAVKLAHRRYPNLDRNEPVPPDILDAAMDTIRERNRYCTLHSIAVPFHPLAVCHND